MITGFNTDVKHRNRVFHIQTEDKGDANPCVESLVYVGGEILATKRTSYAEVVKATGRDDTAVQDLMEQQHRTMIAAIQRGRFDGPNGGIQVPEGMSAMSDSDGDVTVDGRVAAAEKADATAPPGTASPAAADRSLDQMILDYLASDAMPEEIEVAFAPAPDFTAGRSVQTRLKALSGSPARPVPGASRPGAHPVDRGARLDRVPGQDGLRRHLPDLLHGPVPARRHRPPASSGSPRRMPAPSCKFAIKKK